MTSAPESINAEKHDHLFCILADKDLLTVSHENDEADNRARTAAKLWSEVVNVGSLVSSVVKLVMGLL